MKRIRQTLILLTLVAALSGCAFFEDDPEEETETHEVQLESVVEEAELTMDPEPPVERGETITIEASEVDGYEFSHWSHFRTVFATDNPHSFEVESDITLQAIYEPDDPSDDYAVELTSETDGAELDITPEPPIASGETATLTATPPPGYVFKHWELDGEPYSTDNPATITVEEAQTLEAVFEPVDGELSLTLDSNLEAAGVHTASGLDAFDMGDIATVVAEDVAGYVFDYWWHPAAGHAIATDAATPLKMEAPTSLEAIYTAEGEVRLSVSANVDADVSADREGPFAAGESVDVTAAKSEGRTFSHWEDAFTGEVLADTREATLQLDETTHALAVYTEQSEPRSTYVTDFGDAFKQAYEKGEIISAGETWTLDDALVNPIDDDRYETGSAIRLRDGFARMDFGRPYLRELSITHAVYGSDPDATLRLDVAPDLEGPWSEVTSWASSDSLTTDSVTFDADFYDAHDFDEAAPLHLGFVVEDGERVNIDEVELFSEETLPPEGPQAAYQQPLDFPDDSQRLTLELPDDLQSYYSYGDAWEAPVCTAEDTLSDEAVRCFTHGSLQSEELGDHPLTFYAVDESGGIRSQTFTKTVFRDATLLEEDYGDIAGGYYEGLEGLYGEDLRDELHELLQGSVEYQSYGDARDILQETDACPDEEGKVRRIYLQDCVDAEWDPDPGRLWEREHVWPMRRLPTDNRESNLGSDLHNLTPVQPEENQYRGYKYFSESMTAQSYAPPEDVRGDLGRMMFYMDVMYEDLSLASGQPLADEYEMGAMEYLLEWHFADPVDAFEADRNDTIASYQGNRNPFIDIPAFVELLYYDHDDLPAP